MEEVCKNFDDWMHFCFVKLAVLGVVCRGRLCRAATEYALQGRHCRFLCCAAHSLPAKPRGGNPQLYDPDLLTGLWSEMKSTASLHNASKVAMSMLMHQYLLIICCLHTTLSPCRFR
jgi:hypothetical protein